MWQFLGQFVCSFNGMMVGQQFTPQQRPFMVTSYCQTGNVRETITAFQLQFPQRQPPNAKTIKRNVEKYRIHGTSLNRNKGNSGRHRTARSARNVAAVGAEIARNPGCSSRRNGVPQLTVYVQPDYSSGSADASFPDTTAPCTAPG